MNAFSSQSDLELMQRSQTGDDACFAELIRRYQGVLLRVARSRLGRADWAEDVVQETFLAAFRSRQTYRAEFGFRTWLWTILFNQCRGHAARRNRTPRVAFWSDEPQSSIGDLPHEIAEPCGEAAPWNRLVSQERSALLEQLLNRLSPVQADALRLRFFAGLKFQEIADTMDCSLGTAKNRVQWGLLQLSKWLEADANSAARSDSGSLRDSLCDDD